MRIILKSGSDAQIRCPALQARGWSTYRNNSSPGLLLYGAVDRPGNFTANQKSRNLERIFLLVSDPLRNQQRQTLTIPAYYTVCKYRDTPYASVEVFWSLDSSWDLRKRFSGGVFSRLGMFTPYISLSRLTFEP